MDSYEQLKDEIFIPTGFFDQINEGHEFEISGNTLVKIDDETAASGVKTWKHVKRDECCFLVRVNETEQEEI